MTLGTIATLFFTLAILAALPSTSVIAVVSRSIAGGFGHGIATSIGIVVGDICFIIIAILGLSVVAEAMGDLFLWVKLCASIYLIWFGGQYLQRLKSILFNKNHLFRAFHVAFSLRWETKRQSCFIWVFFQPSLTWIISRRLTLGLSS
jgi:threonine/homoserine/homoserine lactone efflux protein